LIAADAASGGPPRPGANAHRGRGITLMRALMRDVAIYPGVSGTIVQLAARIT
jgi:anti-sigma regulatory factor (Ser/Thr protein kinase)